MYEKTTLRRELRKVGFNFKKCRIIYQPVKESVGEYVGAEYTYNPGWADENDVEMPIEIPIKHPILDYKYITNSASPKMPRFIAEDDKKIYFPCKGIDGNTWIGWVYKDLSDYLYEKEMVLYFGE